MKVKKFTETHHLAPPDKGSGGPGAGFRKDVNTCVEYGIICYDFRTTRWSTNGTRWITNVTRWSTNVTNQPMFSFIHS